MKTTDTPAAAVQEKQEKEKPRYKAFISYRHLPLDKAAAERIQKGIEQYTVPAEFREKAGGPKLGRVFRDEDELPVSSSLSDSITYALDHTEFLIVICTPDLPKSRWCEQEIRYFLETHDRDHIIAVLTDGRPEESFSPYLLHTFDADGNVLTDVEPLAANIAGENHTISRKAFAKEMTRIRASLLGIPFDSLWQREKRRKTAQIAAAMAVGMVGLGIFLGVTLSQNSQIRRKNEEIVRQKDQIEQNLNRISEQNEEIREKNRSLEQQMSSMMVDAGYALLQEYDIRGAADSALKAIESGDPEIYDHRAEGLLSAVTGAYRTGDLRPELIYKQTTDIVDLCSDAAGTRAYLADLVGNVTCVDQADGRLLWTASSAIGAGTETEAPTRLFLSEENGLLICKNYHNVAAFSLGDGSLVWNYAYKNSNTFFAVSNEAGRIALFDRDTYREGFDPTKDIAGLDDLNKKVDLILLDIKTGAEKGKRTLGEDNGFRVVFSAEARYGADFSESGKMIACAFAVHDPNDYKTGAYEYYLIDTETMEQVRHGTTQYSLASEDIFYGIAIEESTASMLAVQYNNSYGGNIVTLFDGAENKVTTNLYEQTLGGIQQLLSRVNYRPLLYSDHLAVFCCRSSVFVLDRKTGALKKSFSLQGDVLDAAWLDRGEEVLSLVTEGGACGLYDLSHEEGSWMNSYYLWYMAQSSIKKAGLVHGGYFSTAQSGSYALVPDGGYLTVPAADAGHLVRVGYFRDPNIRTAGIPEGTVSSRQFFCMSPSGKRSFVLSGGTEEWVLTARDAATGEVLAQNRFPAEGRVFDSVSAIEALDEERVLSGLYILPLTGEAAPLEGMKSFAEKVTNRLFQSCRLYNGQLLTAGDLHTTNVFSIPFDYIALDGATVKAINDVGSRMMFDDCRVFKTGANGFVLGYGLWKWIDVSDKTLHREETPAYILFDALGERRYQVDDAQPDAAERIVALGSREAVFACGDDKGRVMLYDIANGSSRLITDAYAAGEIMDVAFLPGDREILILSRTGRMDIRKLETGEIVFSETVTALLEDLGLGIGFSCRCGKEEKNGRLYVLFQDSGSQGYLTAIDTTSWTVCFSLREKTVLGWNGADGRLYGVGRELYSCPAYSARELSDRAEKVLNGTAP